MALPKPVGPEPDPPLQRCKPGLDVVVIFGKPTGVLFVVQRLAIYSDHEASVVVWPDYHGRQRLLEVIYYTRHQPGGRRVVVSSPTVLNLEVHGSSLRRHIGVVAGQIYHDPALGLLRHSTSRPSALRPHPTRRLNPVRLARRISICCSKSGHRRRTRVSVAARDCAGPIASRA